MFRIKYTVSILNSKWVVLKPSVKLFTIPKIDEFIYMDNMYFKVLNVVHSIEKKHSVFIVVEEFNEYPDKK
jgi:hypothetical protein